MRSADDAWSIMVSAVRPGRGRRVRHAASAPARPLEVWEFEACPFCRKVREALTELDLEYVCHPVARGSANRDATPTWGGRKSYPHLLDPNTGVSMKESEDIIAYLHRTYAGREARRPRWLARLDTFGSFAASTLRPRGRVVRPSLARRTQPAQLPVLYQFESCPYCRKVRETLQELNLDHHVKSAGRGSARRAELVALGGRARVPFLLDPNTGTKLYESDAICAYLEAQYG